MSLRPIRVELRAANAFVDEHHRHHDPVLNHRFSLGVGDDHGLRGVAIVERPKAKALDQSLLLEGVGE